MAPNKNAHAQLGLLFEPASTEPQSLSRDGWSGDAEWSYGRTHRYALIREWPDGEGLAVVVGLNPSTADGQRNDPTMNRVCGFVRALRKRKLVMLNLFAFAATDPADLVAAMRSGTDIVGPRNDEVISRWANQADMFIVAWGACSSFPLLGKARAQNMCGASGPLAGKKLHALRTTASGAPEHPLYLPKNLMPVEYTREQLEKWTGFKTRALPPQS